MELTVIGSGTGVASLRRGSPCLAVKAGGRLLVFDLGAGSLRSLLRYGFIISAIDILALTHLHPDHVGDVITFLFATRYSLGYNRTAPFRLLAAKGFSRFYELLKEAFSGWVEPPPNLMNLKELAANGNDEVRDHDLVIKTAPTNHTDGSLAYRVEFQGRSLVYSGDTDESDSLVDLAKNADLLVLEASNPFKVPGHLTPAEAGRLAARAGARRLLLTHFYPPCDEVNVVAEAAKEFKGEVLRAEDGLSLSVGNL